MKYRREIDGTRAIAVLLVILFHAGIPPFGGGFVGVDVFFVISGYLITGVLLDDLEQGQLSLARFYERRARRILPALFLVMFACIPFAWLWLPAGDMKDFLQSLAAAAVSGSNILFWSESGYFDTDANLKPLLHTWSLGVEEQFYLLFPLLLVLCWRPARYKRRLSLVLAVVGMASLALSHWSSNHSPALGFYLLPARAWELVLGALATIFLRHRDAPLFGRFAVELGGWAGLLLILASALAFTRATPFPGLHALVPTIGALLVIVFANEQSSLGRVLGSKALVGVGLISYSAYLWHHPLFAFARWSGVGEAGAPVWAALTCASLGLAYLSWKYVEVPFRAQGIFSRRFIFGSSAFGIAALVALGLLGNLGDGFAKSMAAQQVPSGKHGHQAVYVLGDSHGAHLVRGLISAGTGPVIDLSHPGCVPFRNVDRYDHRSAPGTCVAAVNAELDGLSSLDPKATVLLSSMGPVYLDDTTFNGKALDRVTGQGLVLVTDRSVRDRYEIFEIGLRTTLAELSRLENASIVVAMDVPELGIDHGCDRGAKEFRLGGFALGDAVASQARAGCFVSRQRYDLRNREYKALVRRVASEFPKVRVFDPTDTFCDAAECRGVDERYGFLYRDADHLSAAGSRLYADALFAFLASKPTGTL